MWLVRRRLLVSRSVEAGGKRVAVRIFGSSGPSVVFEACRGEDSDSFVQIARQFSPATAVRAAGQREPRPRSEPVVLASTVAVSLTMSRAGLCL
jgi:hypothetical protein